MLVINDTLYSIIHHPVHMLCTNLECLDVGWPPAMLDLCENRAFATEGFTTVDDTNGTNELISGEKPLTAILSNLGCLFARLRAQMETLLTTVKGKILALQQYRTFLMNYNGYIDDVQQQLVTQIESQAVNLHQLVNEQKVLFFLWFPFCRGEAGLLVTQLYGYFCNFCPLVPVVGLFSPFYFLLGFSQISLSHAILRS